MNKNSDKAKLSERFRGYFPVVIDLETAGFNAQTDALLEISAVTLQMEDSGDLSINETFHAHIEPFEGANIDQSAIEFNGIDPFCALRKAKHEKDVFWELFKFIRKQQKTADCQRSVIVAHNATFDQSFVNAVIDRNRMKRSPFHPFVSFDTASISAIALGQTVLAKACDVANISFNAKEAHSALYDASKTAELFCYIANRYRQLGGWPLSK